MMGNSDALKVYGKETNVPDKEQEDEEMVYKDIKLKEQLTLIYNHLNKISVIGMKNAENIVIAGKLVQELFQIISNEEEKEGDE